MDVHRIEYARFSARFSQIARNTYEITCIRLFFTEKIPPMRRISDRLAEKNTPYWICFSLIFSHLILFCGISMRWDDKSSHRNPIFLGWCVRSVFFMDVSAFMMCCRSVLGGALSVWVPIRCVLTRISCVISHPIASYSSWVQNNSKQFGCVILNGLGRAVRKDQLHTTWLGICSKCISIVGLGFPKVCYVIFILKQDRWAGFKTM